jgi:hypothetical protein
LARLVPTVILIAAPTIVVLVRLAGDRDLEPGWLFALGGLAAVLLALPFWLWCPRRTYLGDRLLATHKREATNLPGEQLRRAAG